MTTPLETLTLRAGATDLAVELILATKVVFLGAITATAAWLRPPDERVGGLVVIVTPWLVVEFGVVVVGAIEVVV